MNLELANLHLARVDEIGPQLTAKGHSATQAHALVESARAGLKQAESRLAKGGYAEAYMQARRSDQLLYQVERFCWEKTAAPAGTTVSLPLGVAYETLPDYWQFVSQFMGQQSSATRGSNLLAGGEFEDLQAMLGSGWRHYQHPLASVVTDVQLSAEKVHGGRLALRLQVNPAKPEQPPTLVETAPLWVTTPPLPVEAGGVVCIHGWVNLPQTPVGSVDGLLIVDSLGGEPLAERIGQTKGWHEITLFRVAARNQPLTVTFALTGLGQAWLDDFTVQSVPRRASDVEQVQQPGKPADSLSRR